MPDTGDFESAAPLVAGPPYLESAVTGTAADAGAGAGAGTGAGAGDADGAAAAAGAGAGSAAAGPTPSSGAVAGTAADAVAVGAASAILRDDRERESGMRRDEAVRGQRGRGHESVDGQMSRMMMRWLPIEGNGHFTFGNSEHSIARNTKTNKKTDETVTKRNRSRQYRA
jgi:hypothetical protein